MEGPLIPPGALLSGFLTYSGEDPSNEDHGQIFGRVVNTSFRDDNPTLDHDLYHLNDSDLVKVTRFTEFDYQMEYPDFSQDDLVRGIFICLFIGESIIGVVGNFFVCLTVYRNKLMHSPVNYYIVNLGICDFLVGAVVLPVKLFELTADANTNMLNDFWCTALRYIETIVVFASVFTLVAICFERYNAVVYPVHSRLNMTSMRIRRILAVVWILPGLAAVPNLYPATSVSHLLFSNYGEFTRVTCFDQFSDTFRFGYFMSLFIFMYLIPLGFITATSLSISKVLLKEIPVQPARAPRTISLEQGRRKVAKMVLVIVVAFIICWSPYFIVTAVTQLQSENFLHQGQYFFTMLAINLLACTNSCINPFVYFAMSSRFRKGFMCVVRSFRGCSRGSNFTPESSDSSVRRTSNNRTMNGVLNLQTYPLHHNSFGRRTRASYIRSPSGRMVRSQLRSGGSYSSNNLPPFASSSGNNKFNVLRRQEESHQGVGRTIVLHINHCSSPSCCTHVVPIVTNDGNEVVTAAIQNQYTPQCERWTETCQL